MNLPNKEEQPIFSVRVKANSSQTKILSFDEDVLVVAIKAPADKNKANTELVKFLSKELGSPVRIKSGLTSKEKKVVFV